MRWSDKDPQEIVTLGWDFSALLEDAETLMTATASVTVVEGTDATPSAILFGAPEIGGVTVRHAIQAGVAGVLYRIAAVVDTSLGNRYLEVGLLRVRERNA